MSQEKQRPFLCSKTDILSPCQKGNQDSLHQPKLSWLLGCVTAGISVPTAQPRLYHKHTPRSSYSLLLKVETWPHVVVLGFSISPPASHTVFEITFGFATCTNTSCETKSPHSLCHQNAERCKVPPTSPLDSCLDTAKSPLPDMIYLWKTLRTVLQSKLI